MSRDADPSEGLLKKRPVVGRYRRHRPSSLPVRTNVPTRSYGHSSYYASICTLSNHLMRGHDTTGCH